MKNQKSKQFKLKWLDFVVWYFFFCKATWQSISNNEITSRIILIYVSFSTSYKVNNGLWIRAVSIQTTDMNEISWCKPYICFFIDFHCWFFVFIDWLTQCANITASWTNRKIKNNKQLKIEQQMNEWNQNLFIYIDISLYVISLVI
jgi:hypothetical protein